MSDRTEAPGRDRANRPRAALQRLRRGTLLAFLAAVAVTLGWWARGRVTADERRLSVRHLGAVEVTGSDTTLVRVLAWNIAHGRGDVEEGFVRNWTGETAERRLDRLDRMAEVLRRIDADIVALNEVDFDAGWSHGVNQAEHLARKAGYQVLVEQRNFDVQLPFESYAWGNALLSRLPVREARWVRLPPHRGIEKILVGAKAATIVRLDGPRGVFSAVPVHLEFRAEATRLAAVPVLDRLRREEPGPIVLAGDFNTAPPGWPRIQAPTALGALLDLGWRSPRAQSDPQPEEWTFPTSDLQETRDWILVEPPLRVVDARVVEGAEDLSDHQPVVAVVRVGGA